DGNPLGPGSSVERGRFFVTLANDPPGTPVLLDPVDGRMVTTATPTLLLRNAVDLDGDPLTYDFVVTDTSGNVVAKTSDVPAGLLETSWTVPTPLAEDQVYQWSADAKDAESAGRWSDPAPFRVNAVAEPPTRPRLIAPAEGAVVDTRHPALVISNATSPDDLPLAYSFELYAVGTDGALTLADEVAGVPEGAGR